MSRGPLLLRDQCSQARPVQRAVSPPSQLPEDRGRRHPGQMFPQSIHDRPVFICSARTHHGGIA
jgi:hypothetical protein